MKACKSFERLIRTVVAGAADDSERQRLESHLEACSGCRSEFERLSGTIGMFTELERPDPGDAFWDGYYGRLTRRMEAAQSPADRPASVLDLAAERLRALIAPVPAWSLQIAAGILLVAVGVLIGRTSPAGESPTAVADSDAHLVALEERAQAYIGRSRTVLLELANFNPAEDDPSALDMPTRRTAAERLVREAAVLRTDLADADRQLLARLIADLELILIQIANLDAEVDLPQIEFLQSSVERGAILFKIDVEELRQTTSPGGTGSRGSTPIDPAV